MAPPPHALWLSLLTHCHRRSRLRRQQGHAPGVALCQGRRRRQVTRSECSASTWGGLRVPRVALRATRSALHRRPAVGRRRCRLRCRGPQLWLRMMLRVLRTVRRSTRFGVRRWRRGSGSDNSARSGGRGGPPRRWRRWRPSRAALLAWRAVRGERRELLMMQRGARTGTCVRSSRWSVALRSCGGCMGTAGARRARGGVMSQLASLVPRRSRGGRRRGVFSRRWRWRSRRGVRQWLRRRTQLIGRFRLWLAQMQGAGRPAGESSARCRSLLVGREQGGVSSAR